MKPPTPKRNQTETYTKQQQTPNIHIPTKTNDLSPTKNESDNEENYSKQKS